MKKIKEAVEDGVLHTAEAVENAACTTLMIGAVVVLMPLVLICVIGGAVSPFPERRSYEKKN